MVNKPGAGGAVGWACLVPKAGDAHFLQVSSYNLVTNHITGRSNLTYTDFTPISLLISEYIGFAVKADSPYKTLADLARALRENPESVPIGTSSSAGGANHIAAGLLAKLPTTREAGFPMAADNWRLLIAPKGLSTAQVAYWDNAFKTLTQSRQWNDDLAAAQMWNRYRNSADTTRYVAAEYDDIKAILTELGLAKPPVK